MKHELFDELVESVKEGGAYRRGEAEPAAAHFAGEPDPREIRARMGLTQEEFSKALSISVKTLRNWEPAVAPVILASILPVWHLYSCGFRVLAGRWSTESTPRRGYHAIRPLCARLPPGRQLAVFLYSIPDTGRSTASWREFSRPGECCRIETPTAAHAQGCRGEAR
jgi:hypothetical protein